MKRLALLVGSDVPLFVLGAAPLAAQAGTCSTGNAGRWCVHQDSPGVIGSAQAGDRFGAAVVIGDFDSDNRYDLAVGAPNKNHGSGNPSDSGRAYVAYGPIEDGVQNEFDILGEDDVPGPTPAADELFGSAFAASDLDGDGLDEVVIGVPDAPVGGENAAGIVYVTRAFDPAFLVVDGFEDDVTASWSAVVP